MQCVRYEEKRDRLIGSLTAVIGIEEWRRRLEEEEDGGILTVLGLYRGERERERERESNKFGERVPDTGMGKTNMIV